ncbi:MAG: lipoate--protein ligase family protein, partial [Chlamydiia bacterium]|nr:lipoate--protein ligase family protein [Chlamydiia bacterium]
PYPKSILEWSETLYRPLFKGFGLRENDYVFGEHKFGGNAQYIQRERWLLHTSFLWDFSPEKMGYLLLPEKRPHYRGTRGHIDFLCTLRPLFPYKEELMFSLIQHMQQRLGAIPVPLESASPFLSQPHRTSTIQYSLPLSGLPPR